MSVKLPSCRLSDTCIRILFASTIGSVGSVIGWTSSVKTKSGGISSCATAKLNKLKKIAHLKPFPSNPRKDK